MRLYVALGVRPQLTVPRPPAEGAIARWFPLHAILPPVNAILRGSGGSAAGAGGGSRKRHHQQGHAGGPAARGGTGRGGAGKQDAGDEDEEDGGEEEDEEHEAEEEEALGGQLLLEPGIAPFLAKLKALLDK